MIMCMIPALPVSPARPGRIVGLAILLLALTGLATACALLARWSWFFELFTHFRPLYLLAQLPVLVVLLAFARYRLALLAVLILLPNLYWVGPYLLPVLAAPSTPASAAGPELRIIAFNLFYRNRQHERVLDWLLERDADVLVLAELTPQWRTALKPLEAAYPYRVLRPQSGSQGLGLYSRVPLAEVRTTNLGVRRSNNVQATLLPDGRPVELLAVHLVAPMSAGQARARNMQLARITALLSEAETPARLLIGDLNLTPFSPWFAALLDDTGLRDPARERGVLLTWPVLGLAPPLIGIDHALVSPDLQVRELRTGPRLGSDHLPVEITVMLGPDDPGAG
jgi:endonuclease/exonuclease/phosphatase (EEP) superfamily protein YafD